MSQTASSNEKPVILVVDDDATICNLIAEEITMRGITAVTANSAQEGLDKYKEVEVTGILLDICMAHLTGVDMLEKFNKSGFRAPVAFISGMPTLENLSMGLKLGAIDFLAKPFNFDELDALIDKLVAIGTRQRRIKDLQSIIETMVEPTLIREIADLERQISFIRTFEPDKFKNKKAG